MNCESSRYEKLENMLHDGSSEPCNLPLEYLRNITNNFSDERLLGEGGFGKVYKGVQQNGETIAVKKLNSSIPGVKDRQFENEAYHLMRLRHPNVVQLVACCSETETTYVEYNGKYIYAEKSERLLCLEYMPKGSLRGYLSDFGLSRLFSEEKTWTCTASRDGTLGYMAPEYINRGLITTKSDIFSLGVIIIEIVTGHRDYPDEAGISSQEFIELIIHNWRNSLEKAQCYTSLEIDCQKIRICIQIGLLCVKFYRSKRPTTSQIIKMLHELEDAASSIRKQTFAQSASLKIEEMTVKSHGTDQWISYRHLPENLKERIRHYEQYKWQEANVVDEEQLVMNLPKDIRRDIKRHLCLSLLIRVPMFHNMDDQLLDGMCDRLKPILYTEDSCIVGEGDPITEILFIMRGNLMSMTINSRTGLFNSDLLKGGDFCGEQLFTWALYPSSASLPSSTKTVKTISRVEAFALRAEDLRFVATEFRRLHSRQIQNTFRYSSQQWRTWAACYIQAAWHLYCRKKLRLLVQLRGRAVASH